MGSLRVGLGQNSLKLNRLCSEDRYGWSGKARTMKIGEGGGGRLCHRLKVIATGSSIHSDSRLNNSIHSVAVRKRVINKEDAVSRKVDQWIRNSVEQIVNNIEEAPFLLHIYPEDDQGSRKTHNMKTVREKASANSWPNIKHRWETGSSTPNGIALVEELKIDDDDLSYDPEENLGTVGYDNQGCPSTKVFGIVIQERGLSVPACYMLRTSRVRSISGICTHFCIFRVGSFGETADMQFKKQWLL